MPSVHELWRAVFPAARARPSSGPPLERPVAWVRVLKARVPAFDALEPDDLAIVQLQTLDSLRGLGVDRESLIGALADAGASAVLLIGRGDGRAEEPSQAAAALALVAARGMAGFLLPEADVSTLERSAIGYIVAGQAELERRVAQLEDELERAALVGVGVEGLASIVARFLGRAVAVEAADGRLLAAHAPPEAADAVNVGEYLQLRRGAILREALPTARTPGVPSRPALPALVLLGPPPASDLDRLVVQRVKLLLALELERGVRPVHAAQRSADALPSAGPPWVVIVARQLDPSRPTTPEERERLRAELLRSEPRSQLTLRGDASSLELRLVAAPTGEDPHAVQLAARLARRLGRPLAVSQAFDDPAQRASREAQARVTLEAVEALPAGELRTLSSDGVLVARAQLAPAYRLLAAVHHIPDGQRQARSLLAPLLSGRARRDTALLATLRAVLDHPGLGEAASALGIHRNTLAYRLQRIEERGGWRLSDPALRLALALAVRLVQIDQSASADSGSSGAPARVAQG